MPSRGRQIGRRRASSKTPFSHERDSGAACVRSLEMQECPRGAPWRKAPERARSIPCAKAARCARVAIAPTTLSTLSDGALERDDEVRNGGCFCELAKHFGQIFLRYGMLGSRHWCGVLATFFLHHSPTCGSCIRKVRECSVHSLAMRALAPVCLSVFMNMQYLCEPFASLLM